MYVTIKRQKIVPIEVTCACGCGTKFMKKLKNYQIPNQNHFIDKEHMALYREKGSIKRFKMFAK